MSTKHEFALYVPQLPAIVDHLITLTDFAVVHRALKVLRLRIGTSIVLFDGEQALHVTIKVLNKKQLIGTVQKVETVSPLTPKITCFIPVLKRSALEEVIYSAVELGANVIQLVSTQKVHRKWGAQKELDRLKIIMIAACEQAKQFNIPTLYAPVPFKTVCDQFDDTVVFFDPDGQVAHQVISSLKKQNLTELSLLIGPEADLADDEKKLLREQSVIFCALTPTVLRAKQAFVVGLGMFRSILSR